jgi:hypothetical protein
LRNLTTNHTIQAKNVKRFPCPRHKAIRPSIPISGIQCHLIFRITRGKKGQSFINSINTIVEDNYHRLRGSVRFLGMVRIIPDLTIIILGVIPLAYFLFKTFPFLKAREIKEGESVWDRLDIHW